MGSRITNDLIGIRGFGRNDDGFTSANIDTTTATFTEASPVPGIPSTTSRLRTSVAGGQSVDIDTRVQLSGLPGRGTGTEVAYRPSTSTNDDDWSGCLAPNVLTGWESVVWGADIHEKRSITTLPDSQRPACVYLDKSADVWMTATWDWSVRSWGTPIELSGVETTDTLTGIYGAVVAISETELMAIIVEGDTASEITSRVYLSDDAGATWALSGEGAIPASNDYTTKAECHYIPESAELLLYLEYSDAGAQKVEQWASSDLGATWVLVDEIEDDTNSGWCSLVFPGPSICTIYFDGTDLVRARMASAFDKVYDQVKSAAITALVTTDLAGSVDADGVGWVQLRVAEKVYTFASRDSGDTWEQCTAGLCDSTDSSTYPHGFACTHAGGMQVVLHRWAASPGTQDASVGSMLAGGWSNVTTGMQHPTYRDRLIDASGSGYAGPNEGSLTFLPIELAGDIGGVAKNLTGAATDTLVEGGTTIVSASTTSLYYSIPPIAGMPEWIGVVSVAAAQSSSSYFDIVCSSGTRRITARVYPGKIEVLDNTTIKDTVTIDTTSPVELWVIKAGTTSGTSAVYYRRPGAVQWTEAWAGALGSVAASLDLWAWGKASTAFALEFTIGWFWLRDATNISAGFGNTKVGTECRGKNLRAVPYPVEGLGSVTQAGFLRASGGPGRVGDTCSVPAGHNYAIEHLFPLEHPSPTTVWRSTDETENLIPIDPRGGVSTTLGSDSMVVYFGAVNFKTATIEGWDGASWNVIGTWDASTDFAGLTGVLTGDALTPNTSTTAAAARYIQDHELVGGTAKSGAVYREIERCDGGVWSTATTRHPELRLGGTGGASGSWELWAHSGIVLIHDAGSHEKYAVRIPAQTTKDGYFEAGVIWMTGLKAVGRPWEDTGSVDLQPQMLITEPAAGQPGRRTQLRKPARMVSISQPNPVLQHHLRGSAPSPDYVSSDAAHTALAARDDLAFALQGLVHSTKGGEEPVLFCPKLPDASTADVHVITDPTLFLYSRIVSSVQTESARGEEGAAEQLRVQTVTLEEITGAS